MILHIILVLLFELSLWCQVLIGAISLTKLTFKYIWKPFVQNNKGCPLVGTRTSNDYTKSNNTSTTTLNFCIPCLPTAIFVQLSDLVHVILAVGIVQKSCINPNIRKSQLLEVHGDQIYNYTKYCIQCHQLLGIMQCYNCLLYISFFANKGPVGYYRTLTSFLA